MAVTVSIPTGCGQAGSPLFVRGIPGPSTQIAPMTPAMVSGTVAMLRQDSSLRSLHRATANIKIPETTVPTI